MATRVTPATGTDRQRLATAAAGKFLASEAHTTSDHGRAWMGGTRPLTGAVYLGAVATEAAMLALFTSGAKARGCFEGDDCYRSDTLSWWKCIANNGKLIGEWQEMSAAVASVAAVDVSYDPTASGLTATDVQAAIDEIQAEIDALPSPFSGDAVDVNYDNTTSGLTATDVQAAIDELKTLVPAGTSPSGSNTQIQFNDGGAFGADSDFTWDKTGNVLRVNGQIGVNTSPGSASFFMLKSGTAISTGAAETVVFQNNAATSDSTNILTIAGGSTGTAGYWLGDSAGSFQGGMLYENQTDMLSLWSNNTKQIYLTSAGRVGIGTSPGNTQLFVLKSGTAVSTGTSEVMVLQNNANTTDSYNFLNVAGSTGSAGFWFGDSAGQFQGGLNYSNSTDKLDIYSNGSIGLSILSTSKVVFGNSIKTSAPSGGTAAEWKLGSQGTGIGLALVATQYIELDIGGTLYKLALVS